VVFLVQAMLLALGQTYPELGRCPVDGMLGKETAQMLEKIQGLSNLPVTGDLDLLSYNRLAQLFRGSFDRGQPPAYG
jgi:hypothetical protein